MVTMVTAECARVDFGGSSAEYMERNRWGGFQVRLKLELVALIVMTDGEGEN